MDNDLGRIKRKLASNTFYLSLDYIAVSILSLFFWSSAGKFLSPVEYGVASSTINLVSMLAGLSGLGLSIALTKLLPEYMEKNQINKSKELIKFSLVVTLLSGLVLSSIFLVLSPLIYNTLKIPYYIFLSIPVIIVLTALSQIVFSILAGYQNMKGLFFVDLLSNASKLALSIILMVLGFSFLGPIAGFGIGVLLVLTFRFRLLPKLNFTNKEIDKKSIFFNYAIPSFIISISTILLTNGQITILGLIRGPEITGIFSVAFVLSNIIVMIFRIMSRSLFPITSQLSARKDSNSTQIYFINLVLRYSLLVSIPILIFFTLFSNRVILIFSSKEYLAATSLFPILSVAAVLYGISIVLNSSVYAIGKPKVHRNVSILSSVVFLLLAFPLTYAFAANGMAYSYLVSAVILVTLGIFNIRKYLKISIPLGSYFKIVVSGVLAFLLLLVFSSITQSILWSTTAIILSGLVYLSSLIFLKFVTHDDIRVLKFIANKIPVFKKQFNYIINKIPKDN